MPLEKNEIVALNFCDFTGGINQSTAPQRLQDNEYQSLKNFEYDFNRLTTRGGLSEPLATFPSDIKKVFYDESTHIMQVFLVSGDIYEEDLSTLHNKVGTLAGEDIPNCCSYGGRVFIASGGKLQYYDYKDHNVTTIEASFLCNTVFERFSRIVTSSYGDSEMRYSAVANPYETGWEEETNDDSTYKHTPVGENDGGFIIGIYPHSGDLVVLKDNGKVYAVSGEYPAWIITEVGKYSDVIGPESIRPLGPSIAWLTTMGLKSIDNVNTYGNFVVGSLARRLNKLISMKVSGTPKVFHIPRKRQFLMQLSSDKPNNLLCYQYDLDAGIELEFAVPINDMVDTHNGVIVASGNKLYRWSMDYNTDNGTPIEQEIITKEYASSRRLFTRSVDIGVNGTLGGVVKVSWAGKTLDYTIKNARRVLNVFSVCRDGVFKITTTSKIVLDYLKVYLFEK